MPQITILPPLFKHCAACGNPLKGKHASFIHNHWVYWCTRERKVYVPIASLFKRH